VKAECENGDIELYNYIAPWIYHWIQIQTKDPSGKGKLKERVEKAYTFADGGKGEEWWTTYRYQLVDQVKGRTPRTWVNKEDSVENLKWVEKVYEKVGWNFGPINFVAVSDLACRLALEVDQNRNMCPRIRPAFCAPN
jgi:hypothetical protein